MERYKIYVYRTKPREDKYITYKINYTAVNKNILVLLSLFECTA